MLTGRGDNAFDGSGQVLQHVAHCGGIALRRAIGNAAATGFVELVVADQPGLAPAQRKVLVAGDIAGGAGQVPDAQFVQAAVVTRVTLHAVSEHQRVAVCQRRTGCQAAIGCQHAVEINLESVSVAVDHRRHVLPLAELDAAGGGGHVLLGAIGVGREMEVATAVEPQAELALAEVAIAFIGDGTPGAGVAFRLEPELHRGRAGQVERASRRHLGPVVAVQPEGIAELASGPLRRQTGRLRQVQRRGGVHHLAHIEAVSRIANVAVIAFDQQGVGAADGKCQGVDVVEAGVVERALAVRIKQAPTGVAAGAGKPVKKHPVSGLRVEGVGIAARGRGELASHHLVVRDGRGCPEIQKPQRKAARKVAIAVYREQVAAGTQLDNLLDIAETGPVHQQPGRPGQGPAQVALEWKQRIHIKRLRSIQRERIACACAGLVESPGDHARQRRNSAYGDAVQAVDAGIDDGGAAAGREVVVGDQARGIGRGWCAPARVDLGLGTHAIPQAQFVDGAIEVGPATRGLVGACYQQRAAMAIASAGAQAATGGQLAIQVQAHLAGAAVEHARDINPLAGANRASGALDVLFATVAGGKQYVTCAVDPQRIGALVGVTVVLDHHGHPAIGKTGHAQAGFDGQGAGQVQGRIVIHHATAVGAGAQRIAVGRGNVDRLQPGGGVEVDGLGAGGDLVHRQAVAGAGAALVVKPFYEQCVAAGVGQLHGVDIGQVIAAGHLPAIRIQQAQVTGILVRPRFDVHKNLIAGLGVEAVHVHFAARRKLPGDHLAIGDHRFVFFVDDPETVGARAAGNSEQVVASGQLNAGWTPVVGGVAIDTALADQRAARTGERPVQAGAAAEVVEIHPCRLGHGETETVPLATACQGAVHLVVERYRHRRLDHGTDDLEAEAGSARERLIALQHQQVFSCLRQGARVEVGEIVVSYLLARGPDQAPDKVVIRCGWRRYLVQGQPFAGRRVEAV